MFFSSNRFGVFVAFIPALIVGQQALGQHSLPVGKWSADPNDCSVTEYETDSVYFDETSITFATKSCNIKDQSGSSINPLYIHIEMSCFEEGEEYVEKMTVAFSGTDTFQHIDTGQEYTKCPQ
ncbi:MAG: hypothetical protein HN551_07125 [Tateyamaria sp.]|nr:hypothetical protein [Tateyamaria sp.]